MKKRFLVPVIILFVSAIAEPALAQYADPNAACAAIFVSGYPNGRLTPEQYDSLMVHRRFVFPQNLSSIIGRFGTPYCRLPDLANGVRRFLWLLDWNEQGVVFTEMQGRVYRSDFWLGSTYSTAAQRQQYYQRPNQRRLTLTDLVNRWRNGE